MAEYEHDWSAAGSEPAVSAFLVLGEAALKVDRGADVVETVTAFENVDPVQCYVRFVCAGLAAPFDGAQDAGLCCCLF